MRTKLLKKIRKRIIHIDYSQENIFVKYLDSNCQFTEGMINTYKGFIEHWAFIHFMNCMFYRESLFMRMLMHNHERNIKNRNLLRLRKKKLKYKF